MMDDDETLVELISEDGLPFKIPRKSIKKIGLFRPAAEDHEMQSFPVHAVTSNILSKVIKYLELHAEDEDDDKQNADAKDDFYTPYSDLLLPKDRTFLSSIDLLELIELTKAANYLDISELLELCCRAVAGHMRGLTTEELRAKFNIVNDFTPEEEERIKKDISWCIE